MIPGRVLTWLVTSEVQWLLRDVIANPLFKHEELHNGSVCNRLIKVRVVQRISRISQGDAGRISTVLFDALIQREEVSSRLGHFVSIEAQVAIAEIASRHAVLIVLPDCLVVIQRHRQVVSDEIFARDSQIHRVPVVELVPELSELLFGHAGAFFGVKWLLEENIVESFDRHSFSRDVGWTDLGTLHYAAL